MNCSNMRSSNAYGAFSVGLAVTTDSMIYLVVLPFLPELLQKRLHIPESDVSRWSALAFEVFALSTLLSNLVVGVFVDAFKNKSKPFIASGLLMILSTVLCFVGTHPALFIASRVIQGTSVTFAWVTGLAFLSAHIGENELGTYVGWTTVGVAVGEIIGPLIGGPIYEYVGHWATFGAVEAMLILDILCRVLIKEKKSDPESKTDGTGRSEHASEGSRLLPDCESNAGSYGAVPDACRTSSSSKSIAVNLAWNWLATVLNMVIIFAVRGALEVVLPLYLMRQYGWKPTHISMALLTITIPAVFNPIIGGLTSRQGPRWWTVGGFVLCGAALLSFGSVRGHTDESKTSFVIHAAVIGIALAALINSNQVAITIASQRYEAALEAAEREGAELGLVSSLLTPGRMLSGVTTSWSAGVLVGPAYSSLIAYTEDEGWETLCRGLGGLCLVAAVGSVFLWRKW